MWLSNTLLELSYAVINFDTQEITWKPGGWTPRRWKAVTKALGAKVVVERCLEDVI